MPWTGQASADIARAHFKPAKRGKKSRLTKVTTKAKVKRGKKAGKKTKVKKSVWERIAKFCAARHHEKASAIPEGNTLPHPTPALQYRYQRSSGNGRASDLPPKAEPLEWFVNRWQECL